VSPSEVYDSLIKGVSRLADEVEAALGSTTDPNQLNVLVEENRRIREALSSCELSMHHSDSIERVVEARNRIQAVRQLIGNEQDALARRLVAADNKRKLFRTYSK